MQVIAIKTHLAIAVVQFALSPHGGASYEEVV